MANYQLMSTQIPLPPATTTPARSPVREDSPKQDLHCFKRGSKMFIPVAMIHCGERLLLTHSPQISLLHLPPASSHRNAASLLYSLHGKSSSPWEEILICYNLATAINYASEEDPSIVSAELIGLTGRVTESDWVDIRTVIDESMAGSSAVYPRARVSICTPSLMKETMSRKALCSTDMRNK